MQICKQFIFDQKRKIYISLKTWRYFFLNCCTNIALKDMFCTKFPPGRFELQSAEKYYVVEIELSNGNFQENKNWAGIRGSEGVSNWSGMINKLHGFFTYS